EAKAYLEEIRLLLRELEVSDCEMQEGSLRCDANINLHIPQSDGTFLATPAVEVKNLNSFRGVERAMRHEAARQHQEYQDKISRDWQPRGSPARKAFGPDERVVEKIGERRDGRLLDIPKATAGWNEDRGVTVVQRRKEEASDYRYFPEPDLA